MRDLAESRMSDDLLKALWMQRLRITVQVALAASRDALDDLAVLADT